MDKLLPCPFCGSEDVFFNRNFNQRLDVYFAWIECDCCGARTKGCSSADDPAKNDAWDNKACDRCAKAWNRRSGVE